ncbi:MAG: hypothetical protein SGPRY_002392 [Prymnesium sp.]
MEDESLDGGKKVQPKNAVCLEAAPAEAPIEVETFRHAQHLLIEEVNGELLQAPLGQVPDHAAAGFSAVVPAVEDAPEPEQEQVNLMHPCMPSLNASLKIIVSSLEVVNALYLDCIPMPNQPRTGMEESLSFLAEV